MLDPVYILIRTSNRPKYFKNMMDSVKSQTYKNIITIVHTDNNKDDYIEGDIIIKSKPLTHAGRGFYNLYCNTLLENIPDGNGWFHFIDDDDMYATPDAIEKLVKHSKRDFINVGRVRRWDKTIFPAKWKKQTSFQTECFFLHTDHKKIGKWWAKKGGDHFYSRQITRVLQTNWIEDVLICKAQEGKGRGLRLDLGEIVPDKPAKTTSKVGAKYRDDQTVKVIYKETVHGNIKKKGKAGQEKIILYRYAKILEEKGKIKILKIHEN